jgi:N utilization substance protein A
VVTELRGEKIDVVPWSADPATFVANALQPAKVREARVDPDTQTALVIVPDYQLSLAIGREGQNARLAARLTGWRIDIKSETQFADEQRGGPRAVAGQVAAGAAAPSPSSARPASDQSAAAPAGDGIEGGAESGAGSAAPAEDATTSAENESAASANEDESGAAVDEDGSAPSTDDPAEETVVVEEAAEEKTGA